jgi:predicted transcriptional regulator with HTH domain
VLKKLFSSSIRADVLALFLNAPEEKFYVREVARMLRKNPSGVKRELDNLEKMGIVSSQRVANLKYFRANISRSSRCLKGRSEGIGCQNIVHLWTVR